MAWRLPLAGGDSIESGYGVEGSVCGAMLDPDAGDRAGDGSGNVWGGTGSILTGCFLR